MSRLHRSLTRKKWIELREEKERSETAAGLLIEEGWGGCEMAPGCFIFPREPAAATPSPAISAQNRQASAARSRALGKRTLAASLGSQRRGWFWPPRAGLQPGPSAQTRALAAHGRKAQLSHPHKHAPSFSPAGVSCCVVASWALAMERKRNNGVVAVAEDNGFFYHDDVQVEEDERMTYYFLVVTYSLTPVVRERKGEDRVMKEVYS